MKRLVYFFAILCVCASCSEKGKQFSVSSLQKKLLFSGDTITFEISSKNNKTPDSVHVIIDGNTYPFYKANQCTIYTDGMLMGDKTATIQTFYKGTKETNLRSLRIYSDLVPAQLGYKVVATYNHDADSYTQGLQYEQGKFYESGGLYGESSLRYVDVKTGNVERSIPIDSMYFAEGLTLVGDSLYQLTWRENTCFLYDKHSFNKLGIFPLQTEGWGICYDGTYLIVSDGSEYLYFYNPKTFTLHHKISVFSNVGAISQLNELEYIEGFIYANVYQTDKIVKINPSNGKVAAEIDFSGLLPEQYREDVDVLNGIAWNSTNDHFYITGKLWPKLFEVELFLK